MMDFLSKKRIVAGLVFIKTLVPFSYESNLTVRYVSGTCEYHGYTLTTICDLWLPKDSDNCYIQKTQDAFGETVPFPQDLCLPQVYFQTKPDQILYCRNAETLCEKKNVP